MTIKHVLEIAAKILFVFLMLFSSSCSSQTVLLSKSETSNNKKEEEIEEIKYPSTEREIATDQIDITVNTYFSALVNQDWETAFTNTSSRDANTCGDGTGSNTYVHFFGDDVEDFSEMAIKTVQNNGTRISYEIHDLQIYQNQHRGEGYYWGIATVTSYFSSGATITVDVYIGPRKEMPGSYAVCSINSK